MSNKNYGTLYLIPSSLGEEQLDSVWPSANMKVINHLQLFIVENIRTARRFLKRAGYVHDMNEDNFLLLDKHAQSVSYNSFLDAATRGESIGLLSEAGCPCIADPGQAIVKQAHELGIQVKPLVGASSIMLALMSSGMNGQQFSFHGYLPINKADRARKIKTIEAISQQSGASQIVMETPFRNDALMEALLAVCQPDTSLCVAADLTKPTEYVSTMSIGRWRKIKMASLHKRPAIFILQRYR